MSKKPNGKCLNEHQRCEIISSGQPQSQTHAKWQFTTCSTNKSWTLYFLPKKWVLKWVRTKARGYCTINGVVSMALLCYLCLSFLAWSRGWELKERSLLLVEGSLICMLTCVHFAFELSIEGFNCLLGSHWFYWCLDRSHMNDYDKISVKILSYLMEVG